MGRWVTIKGTHIWLEEGQSPMDAFIRQQVNKIGNSDKRGAIDNLNSIPNFEVIEDVGKYDEVIGYTVNVKTEKGNMTIGIRETENEFYLNNIITKNEQGRTAEKGAGTKVMNNLKEYADKTGKNFIVAGIVKTAEPFYDKFSWLKKEHIIIYDDFGELFDDEDVNRIYKPKNVR